MSYGTEHEDDDPSGSPPAWDDPARAQPAMPWSTPMPVRPEDAAADPDAARNAAAPSPLYDEVYGSTASAPDAAQHPYDPPAPPYGHPAYEHPAHEQPAHEQPAHEQPVEQQSYEHPAHEQPYEQQSYEQQSYEQHYEHADERHAYEQQAYAQQADEPPAGQPYGRPFEPAPAPEPSYGQPYPHQPYPQHAGTDNAGQYPIPPAQQAQPTGYDGGGTARHAPSPHPAAAPPAPTPRPEDLLVPNQSPVTTEPASWGWRGRLNRGSGGLIKAKASPQELEVRQAIAGIQRGFSRPMTVVVVQPKGGAGKTPTTICLSAAFGVHRGGYVVGWDDNETRGTLAVRVQNPDGKRATVWDLLSDLQKFETNDARVGDLSHYVRAQPSHFDALVSDDNPGNMAQIGDNEFNRLHQVLQRFYRLIVVDTGNNVRSSNWQSAVTTADLVVVVSSYQRDVGYSGSWVLDHLAQTGREELARGAVTVLTAADPTTDKTVREQLISHFTARTRAVAEIPYDQALAHGGPIVWSELAPDTRNAWTKAGATIVDALVDLDRRSLAAAHRA